MGIKRSIWIILSCQFLSVLYVMYSINNDRLAVTFRERTVSTSSDILKQPFRLTMNNSSLKNVFVSISKNKTNKLRIGILIPSSTRKLKSPTLENLTLTNICLPSIYKTLEDTYEYQIYIGIDKGDYLETVKERLETFEKVKAFVSTGRTFTKSVNSVARKAYQDGMNYLVRINDDSSFETGDWTSQGINVLNKYSPMNIGVVGPTCHQGNTAILTHDLVHRSHLDIFNFYYPPYFDNWWTDTWITKVYSPERSTKLKTWVVKHHIGSHGTRYDVNSGKIAMLEKVITLYKKRLKKYISNWK